MQKKPCCKRTQNELHLFLMNSDMLTGPFTFTSNYMFHFSRSPFREKTSDQVRALLPNVRKILTKYLASHEGKPYSFPASDFDAQKFLFRPLKRKPYIFL